VPEPDLHGLFDYLADRFGLTNAQRYVEQIEKACVSLGSMPNRGGGRSTEIAFPQREP
jgi:plasmid stabilization system protein ParE